ncbi:MAG: hypothetical protein HOD97_06850 [Candidatus Marinimicrobia bacterium]|nr:hypothetical protein [Candidatus Neomarinimicrobiota bacterium]MBT3617302.1 hypothetical protein [Candidatus Neomarinimicrobiota bacterium]MBT3828865.1 hypothetical protein [Candidatus Neomarinimicrobiota bacterium]MBT3996690.1 hypothetical protein [Candidatus Neomarinimicrobiota bacterium]MBT4281315.1 hypothetical protein [Candidatus Neomarinimicrobiota bacterium]
MKNLLMVFIMTAAISVISAQDKTPTVQTEITEPAKAQNSLAVGCDHQSKKCDSSKKENCAYKGEKSEASSKCDHKKSSSWMFWKKSETKACCKNK